MPPTCVQGKWQSKFDPASTVPEPFTKAGAAPAPVPTMVQTGDFPLVQDPRFTAIHLPYVVCL